MLDKQNWSRLQERQASFPFVNLIVSFVLLNFRVAVETVQQNLQEPNKAEENRRQQLCLQLCFVRKETEDEGIQRKAQASKVLLKILR